MRASIFAVAALALLAGGTGCHGINLARRGCNSCGNGHMVQPGSRHPSELAHSGQCAPGAACAPMGHAGHQGHGMHQGQGMFGHGGHDPHGTPGAGHHQTREHYGPPGPSAAQVAYPYYTTRGPRDFLIDNPPSIGR